MEIRYRDFIDSQFLDLILEAEVYSSDRFLKRLEGTKDTKIGMILYKIFKEESYIDIDQLPQNYIDVSPDGIGDRITFISDRKAWDLDDDESPYMTNGRSDIKIGRFVNGFLKKPEVIELISDKFDIYNFSYTDKDLEEFINSYKSTMELENLEFELVSGSDIQDWYSLDLYASKSGTLGGSCMKKSPRSYFKIYKENENCRLLILLDKNSNKITGRALVWKMEKSPCGAKYFMDRVYTNNDYDINRFIEYAKSKDWMYKSRMKSDPTNSISFTWRGEEISGRVVVKLRIWEFRKYPYMDTLKFLNTKRGFLTNAPNNTRHKYLNSTEGEANYCCYDGCGYCIHILD
jgi:hypothetical protein